MLNLSTTTQNSLRIIADNLVDVETTSKQKRAEQNGGLDWLRYFYPNLFHRPFADYQKEFWKWGWDIEPDRYFRPRIECEPRGVGKLTNAEGWVTSLVARKKRKMIGYVSLNDEKATKHFESIKAMLESPKLLEVYPHCSPKVQTIRNSYAKWARDALVTESGAMIVALTLLGSSRGWKSADGSRFDVLVLDDIDMLGQSPEFITKLIEMLKGEILAAGDDNTVVLMPQNLIHRNSICSQILDHRADILSDRIFCGAYPLMKWYDAEKVDVEGDTTGAKKWVITGGEVFDNAIGLEYCEKLLNKFGKATFDRECQQDVFKVEDDKDFREWNEAYHIITYSEFVRFFQSYNVNVWNKQSLRPQIPHNWNVGLGFDWGTTPEHPSAIAYVARPNKLVPLSDCFFVFNETVMPKYPLSAQEEVPLVSPGRVAEAINNDLAKWNVSKSQIKLKLMSHEASAALATMRVDLKDDVKQFFNKWKARIGSGVPQIQNLLEIDHSRNHPFRVHPESGEFLQGCPRMFFVVPDEQGKLMTDSLGKLIVAQPTDAEGFARARFEMPIYSHKNTGQNKIDDDFADGLRGLMARFGVSARKPTEEEKHELLLPPELRRENLDTNKMEEQEVASKQIARDIKIFEQGLLNSEEEEKTNSWMDKFK